MKRSPIQRKSLLKRVSPKNKTRVGKLGIVRLRGKDLEALRRECFERDGYRCQHILNDRPYPRRCLKKVRWESGYPDSGHMAHLRNKRMYGDVIDNVETNCADCHLIEKHNPKSVPRKTPPEV